MGGPTPPAGYGTSSPNPGQQSPYPQELPPRDNRKSGGGGFLGKLIGKAKASASSSGQRYGAPQGQYGGHQPQYGGAPHYGGAPGYGAPQYGQPGPYGQHGGGYYPQQGYPPQMGYGGHGYPQQYGRPQRSGGGGMGMAGGAALGVGAGLIGGALVADAINDNEQEAYAEGYSMFSPIFRSDKHRQLTLDNR
jgi:hypothetical protein